MRKYSASSMAAFMPLLQHTTEATLVLLLESIEFAARPDSPDMTEDAYAALMQAILQVWSKFANGECSKAKWLHRCLAHV
jgi:hypothetical protein